MRQRLRACCLSPGEVATPILKLRPVVPSEEEQAKMLQPEDLGRTIAFVANMAAAGVHERNPDQPDLESGIHPDAGEPGLVFPRRILIQ